MVDEILKIFEIIEKKIRKMNINNIAFKLLSFVGMWNPTDKYLSKIKKFLYMIYTIFVFTNYEIFLIIQFLNMIVHGNNFNNLSMIINITLPFFNVFAKSFYFNFYRKN